MDKAGIFLADEVLFLLGATAQIHDQFGRPISDEDLAGRSDFDALIQDGLLGLYDTQAARQRQTILQEDMEGGEEEEKKQSVEVIGFQRGRRGQLIPVVQGHIPPDQEVEESAFAEPEEQPLLQPQPVLQQQPIVKQPPPKFGYAAEQIRARAIQSLQDKLRGHRSEDEELKDSHEYISQRLSESYFRNIHNDNQAIIQNIMQELSILNADSNWQQALTESVSDQLYQRIISMAIQQITDTLPSIQTDENREQVQGEIDALQFSNQTINGVREIQDGLGNVQISQEQIKAVQKQVKQNIEQEQHQPAELSSQLKERLEEQKQSRLRPHRSRTSGDSNNSIEQRQAILQAFDQILGLLETNPEQAMTELRNVQTDLQQTLLTINQINQILQNNPDPNLSGLSQSDRDLVENYLGPISNRGDVVQRISGDQRMFSELQNNLQQANIQSLPASMIVSLRRIQTHLGQIDEGTQNDIDSIITRARLYIIEQSLQQIPQEYIGVLRQIARQGGQGIGVWRRIQPYVLYVLQLFGVGTVAGLMSQLSPGASEQQVEEVQKIVEEMDADLDTIKSGLDQLGNKEIITMADIDLLIDAARQTGKAGVDIVEQVQKIDRHTLLSKTIAKTKPEQKPKRTRRTKQQMQQDKQEKSLQQLVGKQVTDQVREFDL